jgi:hypothetical protein
MLLAYVNAPHRQDALRMDSNNEVIALLLGDSDRRGHGAGSYSDGAQRLVRDAEGRVTLEEIESREDFDKTARITGCFIRGKAIRDPQTREIIGYEMEEISPAQALAAS